MLKSHDYLKPLGEGLLSVEAETHNVAIPGGGLDEE